jgi:hypothetical protein
LIVILGLIILVVAVVAGLAGVLTNSGHAHAVGHFAVFGYHVTGSTGTLFLYGIVVGAVALLGLSLLLTGARRTSRRARSARQGLRQSRRETAAVTQDRDDLIEQRDTARSRTTSNLDEDSAARNGRNPRGQGMFERMFARRPTLRQASPRSETLPATPASAPAPADLVSANVPVSASAPAE